MPPFLPVLLGLGALGAFLVFKKKSYTPAERADFMARLAVDLYTVIAKVGSKDTITLSAQEAVQIAGDVFGLSKTVAGIKSGKGLPTDELWPGTNQSVSAYMSTYINARKPAATATGPKYNDESPVPPFEDPREIRKQAIAQEKSNPTAARILHAKADSLNTLIKAAKMKNNVSNKATGIATAIKSLF